jgi:hypothetical protein
MHGKRVALATEGSDVADGLGLISGITTIHSADKAIQRGLTITAAPSLDIDS